MPEAEFCAILGTGNTSHGYCKRTEWPAPFSWIRYVSGQFQTFKALKAATKGYYFIRSFNRSVVRLEV